MSYATPRNMNQIFHDVDEIQRAIKICGDAGLNIELLSEFFKFRSQGLQAVEIAQNMSVHRVTISRYIKALKSMKETDFNFLYNYVLTKDDEKENSEAKR